MSTAADASDLSSQLLARVASHHRLGLHALGYFSGTDAKNMEAAAAEIGRLTAERDAANSVVDLLEANARIQATLLAETGGRALAAESRLQAVRASLLSDETVELAAKSITERRAELINQPLARIYTELAVAALSATLATTEGGK